MAALTLTNLYSWYAIDIFVWLSLLMPQGRLILFSWSVGPCFDFCRLGCCLLNAFRTCRQQSKHTFWYHVCDLVPLALKPQGFSFSFVAFAGLHPITIAPSKVMTAASQQQQQAPSTAEQLIELPTSSPAETPGTGSPTFTSPADAIIVSEQTGGARGHVVWWT